MSLHIKDYLNKKNLHHACLIQGSKDEILPELLDFLGSMGIKTSTNPDFYNISVDSFKMDDARNLKAMTSERKISEDKKIFLISANSFQLEAQNSMLKMIEEPMEDTHFFVITPDIDSLLPTFISRFYLIKFNIDSEPELRQAEGFVKMPLAARLNFLKDFLAEAKEEDEEIENMLDKSARSESLKFLNAIETILHKKSFGNKGGADKNINYFEQIFKAREFIRQPGSSIKSLMESVAIAIPIF